MTAERGRRRFIPALPALAPSMLRRAPAPEPAGWLPFGDPAVRYVYFARNAIWLTASKLGFAGGEVLVPAYHHGVEVEALASAGAVPRFYAVGPRSDVDPDDVARAIGPRTRAIYLIHYLGFPGPVRELRALADRHGLPLIEDCALALLSAGEAGPLGSAGDVAVFCLYKTLPVPNGGAYICRGPRAFEAAPASSPPLASTVSHAAGSLLMRLESIGGPAGRFVRQGLRGAGRAAVRLARVRRVGTGTQHFNPAHVGLGMSGVSHRVLAALDFAGIVAARRRNYLDLAARLADLLPPGFDDLPAGVCPLFCPVAVEDKAALQRALAARGIETIDFWRDFHPACDAGSFPDVAALRRRVLELPCHQDLTADDIAHVASAVRHAGARPAR